MGEKYVTRRFTLSLLRYHSLSIEITLSWWGGLSTKKFQPECVNEESSTERRS